LPVGLDFYAVWGFSPPNLWQYVFNGNAPSQRFSMQSIPKLRFPGTLSPAT